MTHMEEKLVLCGCAGILLAGLAAFRIQSIWYNLGLALFCLGWCGLVWRMCGWKQGIRKKKEGLLILTPAFYVNTLVAVATGMGIIWAWLQP